MSAQAKAPETAVMHTICIVPKHGAPGVDIAVGRRDDGQLIIVEKAHDAEAARELRRLTLEDAIRTAEHVLACNPTAITWPPCQLVLAAGLLTVLGAIQQRAEDAPGAPAEGGADG